LDIVSGPVLNNDRFYVDAVLRITVISLIIKLSLLIKLLENWTKSESGFVEGKV
jgi:hypothetical protein